MRGQGYSPVHFVFGGGYHMDALTFYKLAKGDTGATGKEGMSVTGVTINTEGELILTIDYRA